MIDIKYLKAKSDLGKYNFSHRGNCEIISDNVIKFTVYNFLPSSDGDFILDGHYTFYVNYKTFDWVIYQSSYYGSLTYVTPSKDKTILNQDNLNKVTINEVEALIARVLLGCYYCDHNAVNRNGINLFSNGSKPEKAGGNFNGNILRYCDGVKSNLLCDHRGYIWSGIKPNVRSEKDYQILKLIDSEFKLNTINNIRVLFDKRDTKIVSEEYNYNNCDMVLHYHCYMIPIEIDNELYNLEYTLGREIKSHRMVTLYKGNKKIVTYSTSDLNLSKFIKVLPEYFKSL